MVLIYFTVTLVTLKYGFLQILRVPRAVREGFANSVVTTSLRHGQLFLTFFDFQRTALHDDIATCAVGTAEREA